MKKSRNFVLFLAVFIAFSLVSVQANAASLLGHYIGIRGDKGVDNSSTVKQLQDLEKHYFSLLQSGKNAEAKAIYKKILPLKAKLKNVKTDGSFIDTNALTFTMRNLFKFHVYMEKKTKKEGKSGSVDVFQASIYMNLQQFKEIFESEKTIDKLKVTGQTYNIWASAISKGNKRTVQFYQENTTDAEVSSVYKKGTITVYINNGVIASIHMKKQKKRFLGIGGFKTTFDGHMSGLAKIETGLGLRDSGEMGRLTDETLIENVLKDKSPKNFWEAIKKQKTINNKK